MQLQLVHNGPARPAQPIDFYNAVREFLRKRPRLRTNRMELEDLGPLLIGDLTEDDLMGRGGGNEPFNRGISIPRTETSDPTRSGTTFSDTFRIALGPHWRGNAGTQLDPGNGGLIIVQGTKAWHTATLATHAYPVDLAGTISYRMIVAIANLDADGKFGVCFNVVDNGGVTSGYYFEWDSNGPVYNLWRIDDDVPLKLTLSLDPDTPVSLVVDVSAGGHISCFGLDAGSGAVGNCSVVDATYPRGLVGLITASGDITTNAFLIRTE